jgi:uncharacterized protein involved in exopolysaccharide biosynthesis
MSSESDSERPDAKAFKELDYLVRHLGDELASFRRRALHAEARVKDLESALPSGGKASGELARENAELRARLDAARARTTQLLDRVRFVRQQHGKGGEK